MSAPEASRLAAADIGALLGIEAEANPMPWSEGMFRQEIDNPLSRFYVFRVDGVLIGYAGFWDMAWHGHIANIAVDRPFRRRGYARFMIGFLLSRMREEGITSATLEVRESNRAAIGLYCRLGFSLEGRRKRYYRNGEDALIYSIGLD